MKHLNITLFFFLFFSLKLSSQSNLITNYVNHGELQYDLIPYQDGKLFGYVDRNNNVILKADYEKVSWFDANGLAQVVKFGLYGLIDKKGKEVVPCMSSTEIGKINLRDINFNNIKNLYVVENNKTGEYGIFNSFSKAFKSGYKKAKSPLSNKVGYYSTGENVLLINQYIKVVKLNGKINFLDTLLNQVFVNDLYDAKVVDDKLFVVYQENKKGALFRLPDVKITDYVFDKIESTVDDDRYIVEVTSGYTSKFGLLASDGKLILDTTYQSIGKFRNDFIVGSQNKYGICDKSGKWILPLEHELIQPFGKTNYTIKKGNVYTVVNSKMETLYSSNLPIKKESGQDFQYFQQGDTLTMLGDDTKVLFSIVGADYILKKFSEYFIFRKNNFYGVVDKNGKIILPADFPVIETCNMDNLLIVKNSTEVGLYQLPKSWIHPLNKDQNIFQIYNKEISDTVKIKVQTKAESIIYTNALKNKTVEKNRMGFGEKNAISIKEEGNIKHLTLDDGRMFSIPKERDQEYLYNDKSFFVIKRVQGNYDVFDEKYQPVFPEGTTCINKFKIDDNIYFQIKNKDGDVSLINHDLKVIFEPKARQSISNRDNRFWIVCDQGACKLFHKDGKKISDVLYKIIEKIDSKYYKGSQAYARFIDIYDNNGNLVSRNKILTINANNDGRYTITQNDNLESCITDSLLNIIRCFPYAQVNSVKDSELYIAKDLFDYGILDKNGNLLLDFKYKRIDYNANCAVFNVIDGNNAALILDAEGVELTKWPNRNLHLLPHELGFSYAKTDEEYLIFKNKKVIKLKQKGYIMSKEEPYEKAKLLGFRDGENFAFYNMEDVKLLNGKP